MKYFSEDHNIPKSMYETKKILCALGIEYDKIHTCLNDCILYQKEFANASRCSVCKISRQKQNFKKKEKEGIPTKVLSYIPSISRFKHFFEIKAYEMFDMAR